MNFLSAGIPVTIVEMGQEALDRGTGVMLRNYEASAAKGKLTPEQVGKAMGLLNPTLDFNALADCDLIIEAVYENMDVKKEVFGRIDKIAKPGAILASNTSYLDINEIAASISRPGDVVGMHFFSPANVMKLLEVVRGDKTAPDVLLTAMELGKKIRKVPVVAGVCHGFIGNRMLMPRQIEATKLLLEGAIARAGRPRPCRVRNADGPVPDGRPRRRRHRLAPRPQPDREHPRRALRDRPLGPEEGRRLLRL